MTVITVDLNRPLGQIDPMIFGHFIEHMHRCLYGGIYEEDSPLSDARGFRQDVLAAVRDLNPPVLRWPGGNFVSGYHWEDGIGPKESRPRRLELAWPTEGGTEESNRFGTDEFIEYCRELGTEPYICINLGTGTLDEARNWLEYCNGSGNTHYANLRRENGHPEPYNVKYWGLGNEMYGVWQLGAKSAEEYARLAREAAKMMKLVDPSIKLISCGHDGISDWDREVLEILAPFVDYHSIHIYTGSDDYYSNVFMPHHAERCLRSMSAMIEGVRYRQEIAHPILIAYDEWNVWDVDRVRADTGYEQPYTLGDALAVAAYLNIFLRMPKEVGMANLAQMVNVLGAMITSSDGMYLQTIYHPLYLYAQHCGPIAVDSYVASADDETYVLAPDQSPLAGRFTELGPFAYLDVSSSHNPETNVLTICTVNRHHDQPASAELVLRNCGRVKSAQLYTVNGVAPDTQNSFETPNAVTVVEERWLPDSAPMVYVFPAHSVTVMKLELES